MKNHEEFRRAVFEKAEKFEAKRKARNKKIAEAVSLCSLALVITLSAYLGIFPSLDTPDDLTTDESMHSTSATTSTDTTATQTTADSQTMETTDRSETSDSESETTLDYTYSTTEISETTTIYESETGGIDMPIISKLEFRATTKDPDFTVGKTLLSEIVNYQQWQAFLEEHTDDYPSLENSGILLDSLDETYFEENTLVIIQYAGYDIIAFCSDLPQDPSLVDEKYTFYIHLRENDSDYRKQIHIMSVDKDTYKGAEIRILETDSD